MKKFVYIFSFIIAVMVQQSVAQNKKIDSLLIVLKTDKEDTNKAIHLYKIGGQYLNVGEYDKGLEYCKQALTLAKKIGFKKGTAKSYNNMGVAYSSKGNYPEALKMHFASLQIKQEIKTEHPENVENNKDMAMSYNSIGIIYMDQGNLPEALKNIFSSLRIYEELNYKDGIASAYGNIGNIYGQQNNYQEALKSFFATLKIYEETKNKKGIAYTYTNIGTIYFSQNNYPEALKNYRASLKINKEIGDKVGISDSYNGIGIIYYNQGNYPKGIEMYLTALKIKEEIDDKEGISTCYINLGELYVKINQVEKAESYLDKALQLSIEIGSKDGMKYCYSYKVTLDSLLGNYKAAFEHHKLYIVYSDSLNNEETQKKSLQTSLQYEFDKKEIATKAEQDKLDIINAEEKQKQRIFLILVSCILIIVVVFSVFMYNRFRITNRQKVIIEKQKQQVDAAYEQLHEKNKEVMDSIRYAKRIQTALITSEKYITTSLNKLIKKQ